MITYFKSAPVWLRKLYPSLIWKIPVKDNRLFLTFDDGPHPTITPFVLEQLARYNAKATFFCVGHNIQKYPETFAQVLAAGHSVANHTFHHVNGWTTPLPSYVKEYSATEKYTQSHLFRPPYGRITPQQIKAIRKRSRIIMWNKLSADFDRNCTPQQCLQNTIGKGLNAGDIILFHDSEKAFERLQFALPKTLEYIYQNGLCSEKINYELC